MSEKKNYCDSDGFCTSVSDSQTKSCKFSEIIGYCVCSYEREVYNREYSYTCTNEQARQEAGVK